MLSEASQPCLRQAGDVIFLEFPDKRNMIACLTEGQNVKDAIRKGICRSVFGAEGRVLIKPIRPEGFGCRSSFLRSVTVSQVVHQRLEQGL